MLRMVIALVLLSAPSVAGAFEAAFNTLPEPYAVYALDAIGPHATEYHGALEGAPDTYEFALRATTTFVASLATLDRPGVPASFSGIIVREAEGGGVDEVARLRARDADWVVTVDGVTKVPYKLGPSFTGVLAPGTYRLEVSTPDNVGPYVLTVGTSTAGTSYFSEVADIRAVHAFHGFGWGKLFTVSHVYLPLAIMILVALILVTVRYRNRSL